jgi:hypothetical protein
MRRTSSKWFSVLGALFAFVLGVATIAALPGCDKSSNNEGEEQNG